LELPQKKQEINNLLRAHPVLLIIDNFETIEDEALVQWLAYLPEPSKGLLTTRHAQMRRLWPVHLGGLPEAEALELIRRHARRLGLRRLSAAADDAFRPLADVTEGNPKAIEMALGYVKRGMLDLPEIVDHLHEARETVNDVFAYLFANAWTLLNDDARQLLQAVSFFVSPIAKGALAQTADLSGYRLAQAIGQLTDLSLLDIQPELEGVYYEAHPLVRAFARKKLETQPAWEAAARRRWLEWYQALVDEHGGEDWEEMQEDYDHLEREWKNILAVLEWCAANGQYTRVKNLWTDRKIYEFANIYGYWTDLLIWSDWIAGKAKEEQDWSLVATALSERNWPLLLQGNPSQLENVLHSLEYAWNFREHIDVYTLSRLVNRFVLLFLQKGDLAKAKTWLSTHRSLIERIDNVNFRKDRRLITLLYYQAEIHYIEEELKKAEDVYKQVIEIGKRSHWQRAVTYSQNQLANVALAQDQLEEAENLLTQGLPIATRNKDKRRIAFYKRSYALLEQKRGNWETAVRWAREALDGFTRLGMQIEIEEMAQLVEALEERTVI
jgi:LuxR family glucitol operon transcriptional activator